MTGPRRVAATVALTALADWILLGLGLPLLLTDVGADVLLRVCIIAIVVLMAVVVGPMLWQFLGPQPPWHDGQR